MGEPVKIGSALSPDCYSRQLDAAARDVEREQAEIGKRAAFETYARCAPVAVANTVWMRCEPTDAVGVVSKWLGDKCFPSKHLVLRGGIGVGKTAAACFAVKTWLAFRPWSKPAWMRPDKLVSALLHDYDKDAPKLGPLTVLDDVGRETRPEFCEALCAALDGGKHTLLITTNLTKAQLRERYDARLLDRLNESATAVDLKGESMRSKEGGF